MTAAAEDVVAVLAASTDDYTHHEDEPLPESVLAYERAAEDFRLDVEAKAVGYAINHSGNFNRSLSRRFASPPVLPPQCDSDGCFVVALVPVATP